MLFNSINFAFFLPIAFALYWLVQGRKLYFQNSIILSLSYFFYGFWDWRFLILIILSTIVDYLLGIQIEKQKNKRLRKYLLGCSVFVNLGLLATFKYFNFFMDNLVESFLFLGIELNINYLSIILPVGISFYTFQTMSYTIDVYRKKVSPTKDFIAFSAFVAFFPQLVAGPIERASNLLPQFLKKRKFEYTKAVDGLRQVLWGFFKKIVIADNAAEVANTIFNNSNDLSGSTIFIGALFFAFQIYCDFSGYSDIAIGLSRLFGFDLKQNFNFPYFSRDIAEFWRKWHISLSTWFRDYVYIPMGGSRVSKSKKIRNIFIIFTLSGLWHGANWTYIAWGVLNALYFLPLLLLKKNRLNTDVVAGEKKWPSLKEFANMLTTFFITVIAWVFFRSDDIHHAINNILSIFSLSIFSVPNFLGMKHAIFTALGIVIFVLIEWNGRNEKHAISKTGSNWPTYQRYGFYYLIVLTIVWFGGAKQEFIYFQF
jgi:alginate O-acetyltransferase complex protein AlgI